MLRTFGALAEVKDGELRVARGPQAVAILTDASSLVESGAGGVAKPTDTGFRSAGADLVSDDDEVWGTALVVKVTEPRLSERKRFRRGLELFGRLHFDAFELAYGLEDVGANVQALETVSEGCDLSPRASMSDIVSPAAVINGLYHLAQGSGTLLDGSAGAAPNLTAIEQGCCIDITRSASPSSPAHEEGAVLHYCVVEVSARFTRTTSRAWGAVIAPERINCCSCPRIPRLSDRSTNGRTHRSIGRCTRWLSIHRSEEEDRNDIITF